MKIRTKLFLLMSVTLLVLTFIFNSFILKVFSNQYKQEKLESAYDSIKQILLSYYYNADDISRFIYESCRGESTAGYLAGIQRNPDVPLKIILKTLAANQKAIVTGIFVSSDGKIYGMDSCDNTTELIELWNTGTLLAQGNVQWIYTDDGKTYLRRSIYRSFPYEVVGYGAFEINSDYLRSLTGIENLKVGALCIIDKYGDFRLVGGNNDVDLFKSVIRDLRDGNNINVEQTIGAEKYYFMTVSSIVGKESAIYAVSEKELLEPYQRVETATWRIAGVIIIIAAALSFGLAHLFTKSLRVLKQQINEIPESNDSVSTIAGVNKQDEIGELANDFNKLLERINGLYEANLKEIQAQQNIKYEMLEWKYRALQSQVSPHFLCNILSSICLLSAAGNSKEVQSLSINASKYIRRNLSCCSKKSNTIEEEIDISQEYVFLASEMSAVPINMHIHCPIELESAMVPCYMLQPLVENCIKHGMPPKDSEELQIEIQIARTRFDSIVIVVSDNGRGFGNKTIEHILGEQGNEETIAERSSFGLEGIIRRLSLQYADKFTFYLGNQDNGGAIVRVEFPIC